MIRPERGGTPQKLLLRHLVKAIWLDIAQLALFGGGQIVFGNGILRVDSQNVQPIARAAAVRRAGRRSPRKAVFYYSTVQKRCKADQMTISVHLPLAKR